MASLLNQTNPILEAVVNGSTVRAESASWNCGVDQLVATASLVVPAPLVSGGDLNKSLVIYAGNDGVAKQQFTGTIVDLDTDFDMSGKTVRLKADGYNTRLAWPSEADMSWGSSFVSTKVYDLIRSLCILRFVPRFNVDLVSAYDFDLSALPYVLFWGGYSYVDAGVVRIPAGTSPLSWLDQKLRLFGFRIFEDSNGLRVMRISGTPPGSIGSSIDFIEGVNGYSYAAHLSNREIRSNWTVLGSRYINNLGETVQVRSTPASVPSNPDVIPPGYRSGQVSDAILTSLNLARTVRNAMEIDNSNRTWDVTVETHGLVDVNPGNLMSVDAPSLGIADPEGANIWIMDIAQTWDRQSGFSAALTGWRGTGAALAAGNDCTEQFMVASTGIHIGDETSANFRNPTPSGLEVSLDFPVASTYTSLSVRATGHGINTLTSDATGNTLSRFEIWQSGVKIGQGDLPVIVDYPGIDYGNPANDAVYWKTFAIPINGSIVAGTATLKIISGNYVTGQKPRDDFELKDVYVRTCGVGFPTLPT